MPAKARPRKTASSNCPSIKGFTQNRPFLKAGHALGEVDMAGQKHQRRSGSEHGRSIATIRFGRFARIQEHEIPRPRAQLRAQFDQRRDFDISRQQPCERFLDVQRDEIFLLHHQNPQITLRARFQCRAIN
ncbi:hypothetical protein [Rhizobium sp. G21]|uniref:hypothetical protein n=1 Tax=Rhizobium sp. G21 TaxID=2758439 RepID=UPI0015FF28BB|nr:hypothetical protein [Rhizobium sp. G21]MBB1248788.1 hypothetical protein [Rhizobium sp. G21]